MTLQEEADKDLKEFLHKHGEARTLTALSKHFSDVAAKAYAAGYYADRKLNLNRAKIIGLLLDIVGY